MAVMGRPTKYTDDILETMEWYMNEGYLKDGDVIPTVEGLAEHVSVTRKTLYEWASDESKQNFCDTLDKLRKRQERILKNKGLSGDFNSLITKMLLSANHNVVEKTAKDVTSSDGSMSPRPVEVLFVPKATDETDNSDD